MTAVGAVDHTPPLAPRAGGNDEAGSGRPRVDTDAPGRTHSPRTSHQPLPPGSWPVDDGLAQAALETIWNSVGVDYARIAALMLLIDSELARAARDSRVMEIEAVARQMHAIADDLRTSARLALAGGIVSSGTQMASAGISLGGGIKGMALTKSTMTTASPAPEPSAPPSAPAPSAPAPAAPPPTAPPPTAPPPPAAAPGAPPPSAPEPGAPSPGAPPPSPQPAAGQPATGSSGTPEPSQAGPTDTPEVQAVTDAPETPTGTDMPEPQARPDVPEAELPSNDPSPGGGSEPLPDQGPQGDDLAELQQLAEARGMDHTMSQLMSARSQNVVLISQGLSMLSSSSGELIKSVMEHQARQKEADIKEDEAKVEEQRAYMDNTRAFGDSMQKSAHDMLQVLQQMQEGLYQTSRSVWSRA